MAFTYTLLANSTSVLRSDGAVIPDDPRNIDCQAYQAWLKAGNTATPAPSPAPASSKPSVTGSKGGNAALTSLISALAGLGLITDSTTE